MPIAFISNAQVEAIAVSRDEKRVIDYLTKVVRSESGESDEWCSVAMEMHVALKRSSGSTGVQVILASPSTPDAIPIVINEENIRQAYPWDYKRLEDELRNRYSDFKFDAKFHNIMRGLKPDQRFAKTRQLDPGNPKSSKKVFYSPNIAKEIDRHYTIANVSSACGPSGTERVAVAASGGALDPLLA
ncbi:MAG: hypothetical protein NTW28_35355 [Candidatus Solibacter sp.]|nr:hypothetical protein [Candidatus Solibacter sp.]